jgi:hypothetical protein
MVCIVWCILDDCNGRTEVIKIETCCAIEVHVIYWCGDGKIIYILYHPRMPKYRFKHYYTRRIITQVISATDNGIVPTIREFWKSYSIWNAVNNIADSWAEIKQSTINKSWRNLWPDFLLDDQDIEENPEQITKEVVELGRQLNLEKKDAYVDEIIVSHSDELMSNEDLLELRQSSVPFQDSETYEEIMVSPSLAKTLH